MNDTARAALAGATETAVLVVVPEVEAAVARHRAHLDVAASWGVPAHLSIVYPFAPPATIDDAVLLRLAEAVRTVAAFECAFASTAWFAVPHLTVGERRLGSTTALTAAERAVAERPHAGRPEPGSWRSVQTFDLGGSSD